MKTFKAFIKLFEAPQHSGHWGINPPQKHPPLFLAKPPLDQQTVQAPLPF